MYQLLLITKYLRRKLAPLFAVGAVMLCTAMVIIVISVMGGFLDMMRQSARTMSGDVIIYSDMWGFPHYQEIMDAVRKWPEVEAATPIVKTYGLLQIGGRIVMVEVQGIEPAGLDAVTGYGTTLYWTKGHWLKWFDESVKMEGTSPETRQMLMERRKMYEQMDLHAAGMTFTVPAPWQRPTESPPSASGATPMTTAVKEQNAMVPGIEVSPWNRREADGTYQIGMSSSLGNRVKLTVAPLTRSGDIVQPVFRHFTVVNEFKSGLYEIDARRIHVPFGVLQTMLHMDPAPEADDNGEATGRVTPARTSEIMLRLKPSAEVPTSAELCKKVETYLQTFLGGQDDMPPLFAMTWQERHQTFLGAVEKEKLMVTFLFAIVSVVAFTMITVVFYMIVLEKTRDIGTLRAIGASRVGVAGLFLSYGLVIGLLGAALGWTLAASVVWNINDIQDALERWTGFVMWNPQVYYFDRIPNRMNGTEVMWILLASVASSVLGSLIPAILAARVNPVESLRYE